MIYKSYERTPNLLRKYRKVNGFTQKEVANFLGLNPSRICKWEKGLSYPNLINLLRLSVLYRTMIDALYLGHLRKAREEIREREKKHPLHIHAG